MEASSSPAMAPAMTALSLSSSMQPDRARSSTADETGSGAVVTLMWRVAPHAARTAWPTSPSQEKTPRTSWATVSWLRMVGGHADCLNHAMGGALSSRWEIFFFTGITSKGLDRCRVDRFKSIEAINAFCEHESKENVRPHLGVGIPGVKLDPSAPQAPGPTRSSAIP